MDKIDCQNERNTQNTLEQKQPLFEDLVNATPNKRNLSISLSALSKYPQENQVNPRNLTRIGQRHQGTRLKHKQDNSMGTEIFWDRLLNLITDELDSTYV